jgi:hypothetical protein
MKRVALVVLSAFALVGCAASVQPSAMLDVCASKVATWAGVDASDVTGHDLNDENPSGAAWDFEGEYPGGSWKCGGPADQSDPASVMVFPEAGTAQDIVDGGTPPEAPETDSPAKSNPTTILAELVSNSAAPSSSCLGAMSALAETSYSAPESVSDAAIALTVQSCATAGEYILAFKEFPAAWGMTDASFIDGSMALITIQSACYNNNNAATCTDATAHGVL